MASIPTFFFPSSLLPLVVIDAVDKRRAADDASAPAPTAAPITRALIVVVVVFLSPFSFSLTTFLFAAADVCIEYRVVCRWK